jgi:hypothetical protein
MVIIIIIINRLALLLCIENFPNTYFGTMYVYADREFSWFYSWNPAQNADLLSATSHILFVVTLHLITAFHIPYVAII